MEQSSQGDERGKDSEHKYTFGKREMSLPLRLTAGWQCRQNLYLRCFHKNDQAEVE